MKNTIFSSETLQTKQRSNGKLRQRQVLLTGSRFLFFPKDLEVEFIKLLHDVKHKFRHKTRKRA